MQVWDLDRGGEPVVFDSCGGFGDLNFRELVFSPDGRRLAGATSFGACLWDLTGEHEPIRFDTRGDRIPAHGLADDVAFTPDGRYLASSGNGLIYIWDLLGQRETKVLRGPLGTTYHLAYSSYETLVTGDVDGDLQVWDPNLGREPTTYEGHGGPVSEVAVSPDDDTLASSSDDGIIRLTDLLGRNDPTLLRGHRGPVQDIAFSPDGTWLASVGDDGTLRLWSVTGSLYAMVAMPQDSHLSIAAFTPDGASILADGPHNTVSRWRIGDDDVVEVCRQNGSVADLAVSPSGRVVATIDKPVLSTCATCAPGTYRQC